VIPAAVPIQRAADAKLLVIDEDGAITHRPRAGFPGLVHDGDIVVANDAATLPASLAGVHAPTGAAIEVRLAGRDSLLPEHVTRFTALVFGAGDFRTPGDADLDRLLPFDEPYYIPASTAGSIAASRARGGRVIAVGTTVVRALEHAAAWNGVVQAGYGLATQRIGPLSELRVVDAIVSGVHERGTSHYDLLRAFQEDDALARMDGEMQAHGYRTHEFGDSVFLSRSALLQGVRAESPLECAHEDAAADDVAIHRLADLHLGGPAGYAQHLVEGE